LLWDVDGNRYLDCISAYSAVNQGHCHPRIRQALLEQSGRVALTSRAMRNDRLAGFLKKLTALCGFDKALPMNTGAEAVETGIKFGGGAGATKSKASRQTAPRSSFFPTTSTGARRRRSARAGRLSTERTSVRSPQVSSSYRTATRTRSNVRSRQYLRRSHRTDPREGGVIVPPEGYMKRRVGDLPRTPRALSRRRDPDRVRAHGDLFACDYDGIKPDILLVAKRWAVDSTPFPRRSRTRRS